MDSLTTSLVFNDLGDTTQQQQLLHTTHEFILSLLSCFRFLSFLLSLTLPILSSLFPAFPPFILFFFFLYISSYFIQPFHSSVYYFMFSSLPTCLPFLSFIFFFHIFLFFSFLQIYLFLLFLARLTDCHKVIMTALHHPPLHFLSVLKNKQTKI